MTVTVTPSAGPKVDLRTEVGVRVVKLPSRAELAASLGCDPADAAVMKLANEDLLVATFSEAAVGVPFSDAEVRRRLDNSIRPLYDARGRIRVSFPKITTAKAERVDGVVVTVTVRETVFNHLRIGDKAQFRFFGQSGIYNGTIVRMSGSAAPPDNLAIQPTALSSGGYRIAVSVPDLTSTQCGVGRTGTVVFNASSASSSGILQSLREAISFFLPSS